MTHTPTNQKPLSKCHEAPVRLSEGVGDFQGYAKDRKAELQQLMKGRE